MPRRSFSRSARLIAAAALLGLLCTDVSAGERRKPTFTKPAYDPSAREVDLFAGIEEGELDVKMIPKNAKGGNLLIENTTDEPLTVKMPEGFVGVHVFKQIGGGLGGGGLGGGLGGGGLGGGLGGQGGQAQAVGGGLGGGGLGGGGLGGGGLGGGGLGGGGGFFSIPAESVARLPYQSVCLAHGKPEPNPRANYEIRPVESFTEDKNLQQLIGLIGSNRVDFGSAQAAAWHLTDDMSWNELANLKVERLGGAAPQPYFAPGAISGGQTLISAAVAKAKKAETEVVEETTSETTATAKPIR